MNYQIGQTATFSKTITEADVILFAGVTGDLNPVHIDAEAAKHSPFKARVAHGALTSALVSSVLGMQLPGAGTIFLKQESSFTAPVFIGDTVTAQVEVIGWDDTKRKMTLKTGCINQKGETVLTGQAIVLAPKEDV